MKKYFSKIGVIWTAVVLIALFLLGLTGLWAGRSAIRQQVNNYAQLASKPRETPIPLQWTRGNKGKRCEARYYFGARFKGLSKGEGYSAFCYELQSRFIQAIREGNLRGIRETLRYGANPKLPIDNLFPPLLVAASSGQADAVRLLLDNGVDVNDHADFERTALNLAAYQGHLDVTRILVERGVDVCYRSSAGTAGDIARAAGHSELAQLLKAAEAEKCK